MSQTITVSPNGFNVSVLDVDDVTGAHHRHVLSPGSYVNGGTWVQTALTAETQAVQTACAAAWTQAVIAAYQAAFPYVAPPAPTQDQLNIAAILANPRRQALLTAALAANDQQIHLRGKPLYEPRNGHDVDRGLGPPPACGDPVVTASNWPVSIKAVLASEGGYVNDPRDPGGETRYGISKRSYPDVDIKDLTIAGAQAIYERDYWNKVDGDALPAGVDYAVLDYAVNSGVGQAAKTLQAICGVTPDGIIGPETLRAVNNSSPINIISQLCDRRMAMLQSLPTWKTFGKGWTNRIVSVKLLATQMAKTALSP